MPPGVPSPFPHTTTTHHRRATRTSSTRYDARAAYANGLHLLHLEAACHRRHVQLLFSMPCATPPPLTLKQGIELNQAGVPCPLMMETSGHGALRVRQPFSAARSCILVLAGSWLGPILIPFPPFSGLLPPPSPPTLTSTGELLLGRRLLHRAQGGDRDGQAPPGGPAGHRRHADQPAVSGGSRRRPGRAGLGGALLQGAV